jgi:hypothetical protein
VVTTLARLALLYYSMKSTVVLQTNRRRPPKRVREYDPITSLRMPVALKSKVKDWAKGRDDKLSISKAICRLVEQALAAAPAPRKPKAGK